jgi:DUF3102 family protein
MLRIDIENVQPEIHQPPALAEHATTIRKLRQRTLENIIEIGRRLSACRAILKEDGAWRLWLETEFTWSRSTAERFLKLHQLLDGPTLDHANLPVSALYLLAAPSTPVAARDEIAKRARAGESISVAKAKHIINAHKEDPAPARRGKVEPAVTDAVTGKKRRSIAEIVERAEARSRRMEQHRLEREAREPREPVAVAENALLIACQACDNLADTEMSVPEARRTGLIARIGDATAILLRFRDQLDGEEPAKAAAGETERLRAHVDELLAQKRALEIKLTGCQSEIEELRAAARPPVDDGVPEFLRRRPT